MTPCSPAFWPCPRWRRRIPCCSTPAWGRARHRPPPPRPLGAGQGGLPARCLSCHGMEARLVRPDSALIPPLWDAGAGEDCPLVGKDAIGLVLVPGLAFDPPAVVWARGGFMTAGWRITPAVPPPCAGRRCCCPKSPRPHDRGWSWCSPSTACTGRMRRGAGPKGPRRTVRKRLSSSRRCTRSCCCSHSCSRSHCRPSFRRSSSKG